MTTARPALELRGSWANRPPLAVPQQGRFRLTFARAGGWLLEQPVGTARPVTAAEPASLITDPASWFPAAESEPVGRDRVAGRSCSRMLVTYSPHSAYRMELWIDDEWDLILAARSTGTRPTDEPRFELTITEVHRA
jgi:hypothetical protein